MLQFIQRFFGRPPSSTTAKERLRLVLLSDHLSLAPEVVDALKHDLIDVISRYLDVDVPNCDVTFEQREKEIAMLANIPILGMRPRPHAPPPLPPPPAATAAPQLELGSGATGLVAVLDREPVAVAPPDEEPVAVSPPRRSKPAPKPAANADGPRPTRRKRRKGLQQSKAAPAT